MQLERLLTLVTLATTAQAAMLNAKASSQLADPEVDLDLACGKSSFSFPMSFGGNSCGSTSAVYKPKYLQTLPDDFMIYSVPSASTSASYTVPAITNALGFYLPTSFRYVTQTGNPANTTQQCAYQIIWQDSVNPLLQTVIFQLNATAISEMIQLEIGSASTYETSWTTTQMRQTSQNSCAPRNQTIYKRDIFESESSWFYPIDAANPHVASIKARGKLVFQMVAGVTGCSVSFRQLQYIDPIQIFDDQTGCNGESCYSKDN